MPFKHAYFFLFLLASGLPCFSQQIDSGFLRPRYDWSVPEGGSETPAGNYGFGYTQKYDTYTGSEGWSTIDMNGDGLPDLVVTGMADSDEVQKVLNNNGTPYWNVYFNNGGGFSSTPVPWTVPQVGYVNSALIECGLNNTAWERSKVFGNGVNWNTFDINGDKKPDLVITGQSGPNDWATSFTYNGKPYWVVYLNTGTEFSSNSIDWFLPAGGQIYYQQDGFPSTYDIGFGEATGSEWWQTMDMNGDSKPDLVVTGAQKTGIPQIFNPVNPFWKVYLNVDTCFQTVPINWPVPTGGYTHNGIYYTEPTAGATPYFGSENWAVLDINADNRPDLVITGKLDSAFFRVFGNNNPYWKVHINTGLGFSLTPITWRIPDKGFISQGIKYGYNEWENTDAFNVHDDGTELWTVLNLIGDSLPDLIVTAHRDSGFVEIFNSGAISVKDTMYWEIYENLGTEFKDTAMEWRLPSGGELLSNKKRGFYTSVDFSTYSFAYGNEITNSQVWKVFDINGDHKLDLVITGRMAWISTTQAVTVFKNPDPYWIVYSTDTFVKVSTPIQNVTNEGDLLVYPNPTEGFITLETSKEWIAVDCMITDIAGKIVLTGKLNGRLATLDISALSAGIYFLKISKADYWNVKLIKR